VIRVAVFALAALPMTLYAEELMLELSPNWEYVADTVMGGVSRGQAVVSTIQGRPAMHLTGDVSLDNNGGFVQVAFDLAQGRAFDASAWQGVELDVFGNGEVYDLRLRTDQITRPWQSFRAAFTAPSTWTTVQVPFEDLEPHRTDQTFDPARLRRLGILAIGREMQADIAVSGVRFFK